MPLPPAPESCWKNGLPTWLSDSCISEETFWAYSRSERFLAPLTQPLIARPSRMARTSTPTSATP